MLRFDLDITAILTVLASLNGGLLAVAVTLVALIPTLVEIARVKSPTFLSGEAARRHLKSGLIQLRFTILFSGVATLLSVVGLIWQNNFLLAAVLLLFAIGLVFVTRAGYIISSIAITVI